MNLKNNIKLGIVGCGRISKFHKDAISRINNFVIVAVCDLKKENMNKYDKSVSKFTKLENMLENISIDILVICTPNGQHYEHAKLAAKYNINAIVEKPLALTSKECINLKKLYKKKNKFIYVVMQNRFNPTISFLKRIVEKKILGKIYFVIVNVLWCRPQKYFELAKWRGTKKLDGGVMINQAIHYIDLIKWIVGPVKKIKATTKRIARRIETEDSAVAIIEWKNKTIGSLNISVLASKENLEGSITILAEKGNIKIGGKALNKITESTLNKKILPNSLIKRLNYENKNEYGSGHLYFYEHLAKYISKKIDNLPNIDEAIDLIKLIEKINISSERNRSVLM
mgnify:CR=1 FL=1